MKIIYIAHPIGGDVTNNINKILEIVRHINFEFYDVVPFVPYLADVLALDDSDPEQRARGIQNDLHLINSGFINECWLYGDKISNGMAAEIKLFQSLKIPVVPQTEKTMFDFMNKNY